jgi:hypothetical protein
MTPNNFKSQRVTDAEREVDYQLANIAEAERMKQPVWIVGIDDDREGTWQFDNEDAALAFAHFDSQLVGATAVVIRSDPDGHITVVATYVR